jgi:hypothetical protein
MIQMQQVFPQDAFERLKAASRLSLGLGILTVPLKYLKSMKSKTLIGTRAISDHGL